MKSKLLIKLGAPVLALSLIAACGTGNDEDPVEEQEAPLNQEENGGNNGDDGLMEDNGNNGDDGLMEDNGNNGNNGGNDDNTNNDDMNDTPLGEEEDQQ